MMNSTRGVVLRRLLAPSAAQLEGLAASTANSRSYQSQIIAQQSSQETKMALPPNVMFDFKSSFAPQKETVEETTAALANDDQEEIENDESSTDSDLDEDYLDDDEDDDDESPLFFQANANSTHRPVMPLPLRLQVPIHDCPTRETIHQKLGL